jgi:hypothetical protein
MSKNFKYCFIIKRKKIIIIYQNLMKKFGFKKKQFKVSESYYDRAIFFAYTL